VKTLSGLESSIQQGQQQLSEMRANESRLRGRIARAEAAAKARAEREAREAGRARSPAGCIRKGTTYKPTESERSLMSHRRAGLAARSGFLAGSRSVASSLWRTAAG
jgi:septal ring factor EnvC (AmiA/AmiB activator)